MWDRYVSVDRWASWSPQIVAVPPVGAMLRPGLTGTVESFARIRVPFRVEVVDGALRTWSWQVRPGPVRVRLHPRVRAREHGSETLLTMRGPILVLAAYAPLARLALGRLVRS